MKRKTITFTVRIQAHIPGRAGRKEKIAADLCYDINRILTNYGAMLKGAQILPRPKNIEITSSPED
jgi:hypothetical protein